MALRPARAGLTAAKTAALNPARIAALNAARIAALTAAKTAALNAARIAALAAALVAGAACGGRPDPSAGAIRDLARAANHRDAGPIAAALSPDFRGPGGTSREELDGEIRRLFAAYRSIDVAVTGLAIERFPEFDLARFDAVFRGSARTIGGLEGILPPTARFRFEVRLARDGERRIVTQATWEEIGR
jgi:hypothetical protein